VPANCHPQVQACCHTIDVCVVLLQVNYHATNEYESIPNYKVLQQGFTAITLTRVRGSACGCKDVKAGGACDHVLVGFMITTHRCRLRASRTYLTE
jgi:hypothetical protein